MPAVGITFARVNVSNPRRPDLDAIEIEFLIDTGAIYSAMPTNVLEMLGVARLGRHEFTLADGTHQAYDVGEAFFELDTRGGTSRVVFAPDGVTPLLGAVTLESLGLMVNPVTRELMPMRLFLALSRARYRGAIGMKEGRERPLGPGTDALRGSPDPSKDSKYGVPLRRFSSTGDTRL